MMIPPLQQTASEGQSSVELDLGGGPLSAFFADRVENVPG